MGASNYKKQRVTEHKDGLNARELAEREAAAKQKKVRAKYILIGVVVVVLAALVLFINSNLFSNSLPALTVNDTDYTVADVNYYYSVSYMTFYNSYGDYVTLFLDPSQPLEDQACTISAEEQTWAEYFQNSAKDNLRQVTAFLNAAKAAGYELTDEDRATIEQSKADYELQAASMGYDLDAYMVMNFGEGNGWKNVSKHLETELIVTRYLNDTYESFTYTDEELDAYYKENADSLDNVEYSYVYIPAAADEEAGVDEEAAKAEAEAKAQSIVDSCANGDLDAFKAAVLGVTGSEATSTISTRDGIASQYGDAVAAGDVKPGLTFTATVGGGCYAVYISDMYDCEYPTVDVRHILIKAVDEDADGEYSDAEKQKAYDRVVEIRDEWLAGTADEEAFMTAATLYSEDAGSNTNGGLYEQVSKGRMVEEFDAFCFDFRKPGDYDIVYGESTSYAGYHLVYFVGENEIYSHLLAENALRSEDYQAATDEITASYEATERGMWRFVMP